MPEKDEVQDEVSKMKNLQIKTSFKKDTIVNFPVWYDNRTKEAFLMHVMAVLDAIKKRGHFKDYENAQKAYVEQKEAAKSAKAVWPCLTEPAKGWENQARRKPRKPRQSPSTGQSKKSFTSQIYLRSPSTSTYVSLYVK
jgi:hypothetical protein